MSLNTNAKQYMSRPHAVINLLKLVNTRGYKLPTNGQNFTKIDII